MWVMGQLNMQYVTSSSFLLTTYAKYLAAAHRTVNCGGRQVTAAQLLGAAQRQVDYILGQNPRGMSYMIGFGRNPTRVHHRAGPDQGDNINDNRGNYAQMEPATYVNAPIVGILSELAVGRQY